MIEIREGGVDDPAVQALLAFHHREAHSRFPSGFAHALPPSLQTHAGSASGALSAARQLGPAVHEQAVNAFTDAMATGYRVTAVTVLIAAVAVALGLRTSR